MAQSVPPLLQRKPPLVNEGRLCLYLYIRSIRHYQKIEAGKINIRLGTLYAIAEVLRMKPQTILDRAER